MKRFIDQSGIREHLATLDLPQGGSNRAYDPAHIIESFWLGIWTGATSFTAIGYVRIKLSQPSSVTIVCPAKAPLAGSLASSRGLATPQSSYNLMSLFRHFGLDSHNPATLATLRSNCFAIVGWIGPARTQTRAQALPTLQKAPLDGRDLPPNRGPTTTVCLLLCMIRV